MKSILDKSFRYTPAATTDIKRTFARIRKQQAEEQAERERDAKEVIAKVRTLKERAR